MKILASLALLFLGACSASDGKPANSLQAPVRLEFRLVADKISPERIRASTRGGELVLLEQALLLGAADVASATPETDGIDLRLTESGTRKLAEVTRANKGRLLAIIVDGVVLMTPEIGEPIEDGRLWIGDLSAEEALRIAGGLGPK